MTKEKNELASAFKVKGLVATADLELEESLVEEPNQGSASQKADQSTLGTLLTPILSPEKEIQAWRKWLDRDEWAKQLSLCIDDFDKKILSVCSDRKSVV